MPAGCQHWHPDHRDRFKFSISKIDRIMNSICFICQKQAGETAQPPGGYFYEDENWKVCHAPISGSLPGTLIIESRRHYLDFTEMTPEEAASFGNLLRCFYQAIKDVTQAERVYTLVLLEGTPHFHTWLVPRTPEISERGISVFSKDYTCTEEQALAIVKQMKAILNSENLSCFPQST